MKQFTMLGSRTGGTYGPMSLDIAAEQAGNNGYSALNGLAVGSAWTDTDGDVWTRVYDAPLEAPTTGLARGDRLERIATAAMAAIIGKLPLVTTNENDCSAQNMRDAAAVGAVGYAKALIAELDKQA